MSRNIGSIVAKACREVPYVQEVDVVNHPKHYNNDPSGIECIQITRHRNFNIGNAIKYLWRAGLKDDAKTIEDLRKAIWYITDEIERLQGATGAPSGERA